MDKRIVAETAARRQNFGEGDEEAFLLSGMGHESMYGAGRGAMLVQPITQRLD
jgi:hypothetical protein